MWNKVHLYFDFPHLSQDIWAVLAWLSWNHESNPNPREIKPLGGGGEEKGTDFCSSVLLLLLLPSALCSAALSYEYFAVYLVAIKVSLREGGESLPFKWLQTVIQIRPECRGWFNAKGLNVHRSVLCPFGNFTLKLLSMQIPQQKLQPVLLYRGLWADQKFWDGQRKAEKLGWEECKKLFDNNLSFFFCVCMSPGCKLLSMA